MADVDATTNMSNSIPVYVPFFTISRSMPTANAENEIESEGGIGRVPMRRVFGYD